MTKKRNNKKSVPVQEATGIKLVRYTKKVFLDSFPDATTSVWEFTQHPNCLSEFIWDQIEIGALDTSDSDKKITIVTLDGEYLDWLKKKHKANTMENRLEYCSIVDESKATQLMKKNAMHKDEYVLSVAVVLNFFPDFNRCFDSDYFIPSPLCRQLETEIAKMCPGCTVKVPGTVIRARELEDYDAESWEDVMFIHVDHDDAMWDSSQEYDSPMLPYVVLFVPFLLVRKQSSATFTMHEFLDMPKFDPFRGVQQVVNDESADAAENIAHMLASAGVFDCQTVAAVPFVINGATARQVEREILVSCYNKLFADEMYDEDFEEEISDDRWNFVTDPKMRA